METPAGLAIIFAILLVLYVFFRMFIGRPISELLQVLKGGQGGCGCLVRTILGTIAGGVLIWYIITELI